MCQYSLEAYTSKDAKKGDDLVLKRFPSGTQGFVRPDEPDCPRCIKEGAMLMVKGADGVPRKAMFDALKDQLHTDALIFEGDNVPVSLQAIPQGTEAHVLEVGPTKQDTPAKVAETVV